MLLNQPDKSVSLTGHWDVCRQPILLCLVSPMLWEQGGSLPYPCLRWDADPGYIHVAVQKIKLCLKRQNQTKDEKRREQTVKKPERKSNTS